MTDHGTPRANSFVGGGQEKFSDERGSFEDRQKTTFVGFAVRGCGWVLDQ